ncbi:hypothetical protein [Flavobacterium sp.]|uniref:hypothetical protein n=1 Tax=Flavobacterium sp. TaxID=239 RepID=UPI002610F2D5|nr:hypothetical protein [Flavobacterium sp.]
MKKYLFICVFLLSIIFVSCNKNQSESKTASTKADSIENNNVTPKDNSSSQNDLADFSELVPLTIVDSTSQDVYEKYGIEFSGNCYACDLAKIEINKKHIDLVNVCNEEDVQRFEILSYSNDNKILKIKTKEQEFLLTKMDEAPIYKLTINGKELTLENKRIAMYFTQSKTLNKFKEHDCGDFEE